ncbi:MAG TPA: hypothetical protein VGF14_01965 [Alphaproteobacteria bacterium]
MKDINTERRVHSGRVGHMVPAYCLLSDQFAPATMPEDYCISRDAFYALPPHQVKVSFHVKKSMLGTVIKGYNGQVTR